jgi:hypothetical protein
MSAPVSVSIPHRLGRAEATRRLKEGLERTHGRFGAVATIEEPSWHGDTLDFRLRVLGQQAMGRIDVLDDRLVIALTLPWLLAKMAERLLPTLGRDAARLIEKN